MKWIKFIFLLIFFLVVNLQANLINPNFNLGYTLSTSAALNNRQLHQREIDLAKQKSAEYANLKGISQEEALKRLLIAGASMTDMLWANSFDTNSDDIAGAIEYLSQFKNQTYIDKDGKAQNYFVASDGDYYKSYINLYEPAFSEVPNLSDYLQSGITQSPYQGIIGKIENASNYALNNKMDTAKAVKNEIKNSLSDCVNSPLSCGSNILQGIGNGFIDGSYALAYNFVPTFANDLNNFYGFNASDYLVALGATNIAGSSLEATGVAGLGKVAKDGVVAVGKAGMNGASKFATQIETNALTKITENLPKGYKFDTATGTAISPNGTRYAMNGVTDISGSPVWQQIGKQGSLTEQYFVFANNAKQQITKPQILKNQPQSIVWDSAYRIGNIATDPRTIGVGIGTIEFINDRFNNSMPPTNPYSQFYYIYENKDTLFNNIGTILNSHYGNFNDK